MMKKKVRAIGLFLSVLSLFGSEAFGSDEKGSAISSDEALKWLLDGNQRYKSGAMKTCEVTSKDKRHQVAKGQKPYAVIISCSDSRVPPELIFDASLGDIFVIRTAGNIVDKIAIGSVEYAVEHLGSPLIMVLGHTRCGAVTAALESDGKAEGNIGEIVKTIAPAVKKAKEQGKALDKPAILDSAIDENVRLVAENLVKQSPVIQKLVDEGKVKIIKAKYDLDTGAVTVLEDKKP
ncbi:MAG: carbonic anhydrase [Thermodesulforhabdaceae bacterium]